MSQPTPDLFWRYLPADPASLAWGLAVVGAGWSRIGPGRPYPPVQHPSGHDFAWSRGRILNEYQCFHLARGRGRFESRSGGSHTLEAGDVVLLLPGEWHRYEPDPATGWDESWVAFTGPQAQAWQAAGILDPAQPVLHLPPHAGPVTHLRAIAELLATCPPGYAALAAARVGLLLAEVRASEAARHQTGRRDVVGQVCQRLAADYRRPPSITALALELDVPERTLRRAFVAATGLSPTQWLLRLRCEAAERLLATGLPIAEVAASCGFASVSFFSRRFRAHSGQAPGQWRRPETTPP